MKTIMTTIKEIFSHKRQLIFPIFQREYCWTAQQWEQFWKFIVEFCQEGQGTRFIGTILTQPEPLGERLLDKAQLLDGKQRIMTAFILLALIRDLERACGNIDDADYIHEIYLINRHVSKDGKQKIVPHEQDEEAFGKLMDGTTKVPNQIFRAYEYFEQKIKETPIPLKKLQYAVLNLEMVNLVLEGNDDAQQIWETLEPQWQQIQSLKTKNSVHETK